MSDRNSSNPGQAALTSIGGTESKSPADRIRQIQQMQQASTAQPATPNAPSAPVHVEHAAKSQPEVVRQNNKDGFSVVSAEAVKASLQPQIDVKHVEEVARRQIDDQALFVGDDVEVIGNPWKVIPFGDELPALFETKKPFEFYEAEVPKNAVKTPEGLLFQVALQPKDKSEQPQIRTVITTPEGKLQGAQCENPQQLQRLLNKSPGLFERLFGFAKPQAGVTVKEGTEARFTAQLERPARGKQPARTETVHLNNFGQRVMGGVDRQRFDFKYPYKLDAYEAGFAPPSAGAPALTAPAAPGSASQPVARPETAGPKSSLEWWT